MTDAVLSIVVLAAIALIVGAVFAYRSGYRRQAGLMVILALVMGVNVAIWTVPNEAGQAPLDRIERGG
ncbi:hypothetical protein GCM10022600_12030 [Qipengyuania pelagi]|uniref:Uncharacterized protein n=1 Tax=Qipengyuania pelagi TaxID=994320 RepID=A0A844Y952_9SPHN|nr:hypothetical protein [Qipengyuania pelagi]MXO53927.1 hypothetical protein [Qipengyuania pelagi]